MQEIFELEKLTDIKQAIDMMNGMTDKPYRCEIEYVSDSKIDRMIFELEDEDV